MGIAGTGGAGAGAVCMLGWVRLWRGCLSLAPIGHPLFFLGSAVVAVCLSMSILEGVLVAGTWDLVTCATSANASGNCSMILVR